MRLNSLKPGVAVVALALVGAMLCFAWLPGRMTGGGSFFQGDLRVTHGFELHCGSDANPAPPPPNNLQVNWGPGNHFHLESMVLGDCSDDPSIEPHPPNAPFDTYRGVGIGRYNGVSGAVAEWTFTDAGEPGRNDTARIQIRDANGVVVLSAGPSPLTFGNHQAHKSNR